MVSELRAIIRCRATLLRCEHGAFCKTRSVNRRYCDKSFSLLSEVSEFPTQLDAAANSEMLNGSYSSFLLQHSSDRCLYGWVANQISKEEAEQGADCDAEEVV